MKTLLSMLGYSWAVVCIILIPATFIGNGAFSNMLSQFSFMKVNPIYSGGDLDHSLNKGDMKVEINKPVFAALIGESAKGFVQVKWVVKELPPSISDTIDFDKNGTPDFSVKIDTKTGKTEFNAIDKNVVGLRVSSKVKESWLIRVNIKNPKK